MFSRALRCIANSRRVRVLCECKLSVGPLALRVMCYGLSCPSCYERKEVDNTTAHHDLALMEENVFPRSSKDLTCTIIPVFTRHWVRKNRRKTGMGIFRKQAINGARAGSVRCTARGAGAHAFWPWAAAHASPAGGPSMHPPQYPPSCRTIAHTVRRRISRLESRGKYFRDI